MDAEPQGQDGNGAAEAGADLTWDIHGGLRLGKVAAPDATATRMPMPAQLALALEQPKLRAFRPLVGVGDKVDKHQAIARGEAPHSCCLHAPSSGVVSAIEARPLMHPSRLPVAHIVIDTDGKERSLSGPDEAPGLQGMEPERLCRLMNDYGITGHGGGNYLSARKIADCARSGQLTLIVNACECDPCIKCDHALMVERPGDVVDGIKALVASAPFTRVDFGIEDNTPDALEALLGAGLEEHAKVKRLPSVYPIGNEKQLIYAVSGRRIGLRDHPSDVGIVVLNVATVAAIARALLHNEPVVERLVTVAGGAIARPANVWAPIGASLADIIEHCGGLDAARHRRTLVGGKMMGFEPASHQVHIMRNTNALLFTSQEEDPPPPDEMPCIHCGFCQNVCPAVLQPQQMLARIETGHYRSADVDYHLFQCIECGCCDEVCPSHIPLTSYFRFAKGAMRRQTVLARQKGAHDRDNARRLERLGRASAQSQGELGASRAAIEDDEAHRAELIASASRDDGEPRP